jgi:hypothetical protein
MSRVRDVLALIGVATALPGATLVLGQEPGATISVVVGKAEVQAQPKPKQVEGKKVEVKRRDAVKAVRIRPALVAPAAVLDAQAAQFAQQFRPLARGEYYFIKNVCEPTGEQRKQLAEVSEQATRGAARKFVEVQQKMMRGGWTPGMTYPDPRKLVEDEVIKSIGFLSKTQLERYQRERDLRAASRKEVFIDNLVAKLDADLVLTPQQREKLARSLAANWNDSWGQSLETLSNLDNFFPNVADQVITPLLTEKQKAVWRRVPRNQNVFSVFAGMAMWDPDPLDDPELVEARKAADLKEKK